MAKAKNGANEVKDEAPEELTPEVASELTPEQKQDMGMFFRRAMEKKVILDNLKSQIERNQAEYSADCERVFKLWQHNEITYKGVPYQIWKNSKTFHIREINVKDKINID